MLKLTCVVVLLQKHQTKRMQGQPLVLLLYVEANLRCSVITEALDQKDAKPAFGTAAVC
jgi:hypothetical protein